MLKLRPYKCSDAETIISWCKDESSFRRWTSDRYDHFPITAAGFRKAEQVPPESCRVGAETWNIIEFEMTKEEYTVNIH